MISFLLTVFSLVPFYLLGCVPVGVLISRRYGVDISSCGSGNVGAANVTRVIGLKAGAMTLAGDTLKGLLAVALGIICTPAVYYPCLTGLAAVAGHCFSIPGRLKGGRGVATTLGAALLLSPGSAVFGLGVYALCMWWFRIPSLASLSAVMFAPLFAFLRGVPEETSLALAAMALLVFFRHRENIRRLIEGSERKLKPPESGESEPPSSTY